MSKSRNGHRGGVPFTAGSPRFGAPGKTASASDLIPRAKPAIDLEAFLAKASNANSKFRDPAIPGISAGAATSPNVSPAQARKAERCASEGARLISEGRPAEAIPLLQRSIELNPGAAMSHHDLGVAVTAAGRLEEAVEAFTAALRLDPSLATTHHFRAVILDNLGQVANAMEGYQAAVALNPDLVAAQIRLGEIYLGRRLRAESAAAFRAAAAAAKGTAWARIAEARALEASGAVDDALVAIRAGAEAHSLLGKLLGEAGLFAEAAAHYERAVELSPDMSLGWFGLATNRKFTADDGPLVARMNAALGRSNVTPSYRLQLHFALGKAHDDMGNYQEAMQNFEAGNRFRALGGRVGRQALAHYVDRLIDATPPGYRDRQPDPGVEDATPILIVGMPRSGSTLIEQILSSHPEIAAGGEQEFWGARYAAHGDIWGLTPTPEATRRLADDYLAELRAFGRDAKRLTDKMLSNFMLLGVIHRVFPNATIIHCRRDPIDTALSIFTTHFEANLNYASDLGDIVFFTRQYQRLMAHWREVLPPDRLVEVDYEALVADPVRQIRRLIAACGLEWNDACLAPHQNRRRIETASLWQARQPIYRSSVERWRRHEPWLGKLRELATQVLTAWRRRLDMTRSFSPYRFTSRGPHAAACKPHRRQH